MLLGTEKQAKESNEFPKRTETKSIKSVTNSLQNRQKSFIELNLKADGDPKYLHSVAI